MVSIRIVNKRVSLFYLQNSYEITMYPSNIFVRNDKGIKKNKFNYFYKNIDYKISKKIITYFRYFLFNYLIFKFLTWQY